MHHLRLPIDLTLVRCIRAAMQTEQAQRGCDLALRAVRCDRVDVGLVDQHQIGQFHHAFLDRLQIVPGVGQLHQHKHVSHVGHRRLRLSDPNGLDQHDVVARRLADQHGLARLLGHAAQRAAARTGSDVGILLHRQLFHARLDAQNGAA